MRADAEEEADFAGEACGVRGGLVRASEGTARTDAQAWPLRSAFVGCLMCRPLVELLRTVVLTGLGEAGAEPDMGSSWPRVSGCGGRESGDGPDPLVQGLRAVTGP